MEALAAVSLAGTVVQFVHFGCSLVSKASEIHRSGSGQLQENEELDLIAKSLSRHCAEIQAGLLNADENGTTYQLAVACKKVADELVVLISRLRGNGGHTTKWASFRNALKGVLEKKEFQNLCQRMKDLRTQMNTQMLAEYNQHFLVIRAGLQTLLADKDTRRHDFDGDVSSAQNPSKRANMIKETLHQVNGLLSAPSDSMEETPINETNAEDIKEMAKFSMTILQEQRILESLRYETMGRREANVSEAHSQTFRWILHPYSPDTSIGSSKDYMRTDFMDWLQYSDNIYWVAGKPGSGKSTLMKYILSDPKTRQYLDVWAGSNTLYVASHFFWYRGTDMERSQQGLLQTLLHAILEATPGLANSVCPTRMKVSQTTWTLPEMKEIFKKLGQTDFADAKFCFFIDGLDEYCGDHDALIRLLQDLSRSPRIKLCVASRPWLPYEDAFNQPRHQLSLQDLTKPDIERYTRQNITHSMRQRLSVEENQIFEEILNEVVHKSQGVFLWVVLVVHSIREGIRNYDSMTTLRQRVREFPADLEPFFEAILQSVDSVYRVIMAKTFLVHLAMEGERAYNNEDDGPSSFVPDLDGLPLVTHVFLENDCDHILKLPLSEPFSDSQIATHQFEMGRRIRGRYKGLLEIHDDPGNHDRHNGSCDYLVKRVDFLHRSIREFLQTEPMQRMLLSQTKSSFSVEEQLWYLHLAQLKTMPCCNGNPHFHETANSLLNLVYCGNQRNARICQYRVLEELRKILGTHSEGAAEHNVKYLGLLAFHRNASYIQEYILQHPDCASQWADFSPVLFFFGYRKGNRSIIDDLYKNFPYGISGSEELEQGAYSKIVKMFFDAGLDPRHDAPETSTWIFLTQHITGVSNDSMTILFGKSLLDLIDMCMEYGATFRDLLRGEESKQWVAGFISQLIFTDQASNDSLAYEFLKRLLAHGGLSLMQRHETLGNASLWELILNDILLYDSVTDYGDVDGYANHGVIEFCLRHGADYNNPHLLDILDRGNFSAEGTQRIRTLVRELRNKSKRKKKQKSKQRGPENQTKKVTKSGKKRRTS